LSSLILPEDIHSKSRAIPRLLETGSARAVIVRGPLHNGRRTLLRAIAKELDAGTLEIAAPLKPEDERWRWLGTLAMILGAMPVFSFDLGPGETLTLPELPGFRGPIGVALSKHGGLSGSLAESAVLVEVPTPGTNLREHLWTLALNRTNPTWTGRFHLTSGGIMRAAALARGQATLEGRSNIEERDVRHANRALQQPLETLARRLEACGGWSGMVVAQDVFSELHALENRCRYREKLSQAVGAAAAGTLNRGVRALFSGPSGAGKTLAARLLAGELGMDLYRVDLSAVVNKYIGESEKNLNQVFSRAEELDVVLLLDEGDALLTARTSVQSSNDRYANLETNYLLQRIESFEGILIVTTNAPQSIDSAFQRRMDVVVQFRLPEPEERWNIWQLHLPADHEVDQAWLEDVAVRCTLSGGQIRNAVLHAALVAMDDGGRLRFTHVEQAVQREYRKMGSVCPLRRPAQAGR
jgi:tRNA A37 threonylcarbamoyladenosine biosynthesis protein TsaE